MKNLTHYGRTGTLESMEMLTLAGYNYWFSEGSSDQCLLLFHGTGGDGQSMLELGRAIDDTASLFAIDGQVMEGSSRRFFARHDEGVYDMADVERRTDELAELIGQIKASHIIDHKQLIGVGYSNGANILASLLLHKPQAIRYGILFRSLFPDPPATIADLSGQTILMTNGVKDSLVPEQAAHDLEAVFKQRGAHIGLAMVDGGHELNQMDVLLAREWLGKV